MEHDFTKLPLTKSVLDVYPILKNIFKKGTKESVIRYVIAYYNRKSPLRQISDPVKRKHQAALQAGFIMTGDRFPKDIEDVMSGKDPEINDMIIAYTQSEGSSDYVILAGYEQALSILTLGMLSGEFDKNTIKMIQDLEKEIDKMKDKILSKDRSLELEKALYSVTDQMRIEGLKPEAIARKLMDEEEPVGVKPYGEDYKFERYGQKDRIPDLRGTAAKKSV